MTTLNLDYLIIGHGLAGAVLTHTLTEAGARVLVLDAPAPDSASRVAAGLVNPLAGRRFAVSWRAAELLPAAAAFYQRVEAALGGGPWWHERPIWKLFTSVADANTGLTRVGEEFVSGAVVPTTTAALHAPFGGLVLRGGFLQTELFLDALAAHRRARGELQTEVFDAAHLTESDQGAGLLAYQLADGYTITTRRVIFCDGAAAARNPLWQWLPFAPNNGQVLDVELPEHTGLPPDTVLNSGAYAVPRPGHAGAYRLGATYEWADAAPAPTPAGRADLLGRLARFAPGVVTVVGHRAGRRPAVRDRRPLVGFHPQDARLALFNGLGSKGVGLAPGLARHFAAVLGGAATLWPEVNLERFAALYPAVA